MGTGASASKQGPSRGAFGERMKGLEPSALCMANVSWDRTERAPERLNQAVSGAPALSLNAR
jgi:hypothetical protein